MEIVLNDIAWRYKCPDKYVAIANIKTGMNILLELRKQDPSFKLHSKEKITGSELASEYYFEQLFSEKDNILPRKYKTAVKTFLLNFNAINDVNGNFEMGQYLSSQCGYAYSKKRAVFSIITDDFFAEEQLLGVYENLEGKREEAYLTNISKTEHIEKNYSIIESRIYEANPKHKINYGWGSVMDLEDEKAQMLLNKAIKVDGKGKHLAARYKGVYYSFRCHLKNYYHGYQDNNLPEYIKKQLEESEEIRKL